MRKVIGVIEIKTGEDSIVKTKILTLVMAATLSQLTLADNNHEKFKFETGETFKNINLDYEVTKTYFRTDYVSAICSRSVMSGGRFYTQYYTCIQPQTVAYQMHDYNVFANVNFHFEAVPANAYINPIFDLKLKNTNLQVEVSKVKNMVVVGSAQVKPSRLNNNDKLFEIDYQIKFLEASPIFAPLTYGIKDLKVENSYLTFIVGKSTLPEFNQLSLEVKKSNFFKDKTLLNKVLRLEDLVIEPIDEKLNLVKVDLSKLAVEFKQKDKYVFIVSSQVTIPGEILNKDELPKFEISEKIKSKTE